MPVEVGDPELRAGLAAVRALVEDVRGRPARSCAPWAGSRTTNCRWWPRRRRGHAWDMTASEDITAEVTAGPV